jgi:hypothetical protein
MRLGRLLQRGPRLQRRSQHRGVVPPPPPRHRRMLLPGPRRGPPTHRRSRTPHPPRRLLSHPPHGLSRRLGGSDQSMHPR